MLTPPPTSARAHAGARPITRRRALGYAVAALAGAPAVPLLAGRAVAEPTNGLGRLTIRPRVDWAAGRTATGPLPSEEDGDVRFLLVHHSVSANNYSEDAVPGMIRGFFDAHTGAKGWADVAYNFFVDRFGGIWEGRTGSLDAPVIADATGGNQGFSQLCCLIGDFRTQPPSEAALTSATHLLAALADRYHIDTAPNARAEFLSRGSNRWPQGAAVITPTIAGHRDMSRTECPGDACYALIRGPITAEVNRLRDSGTTAAASPTSAVVPPPPGTPVRPSPQPAAQQPNEDGGLMDDGAVGLLAAAAASAAAVWILRQRRTQHRADSPADANRTCDQQPSPDHSSHLRRVEDWPPER